MRDQSPNKTLEPTAESAVSPLSRAAVSGRLWLSFFRYSPDADSLPVLPEDAAAAGVCWLPSHKYIQHRTPNIQ